MVSDYTLFDALDLSTLSLIPYNPDHNLDEDSWFKIENFSQQSFCLSCIKDEFDSKDFDDLTKKYFTKISYIFSHQNEDFYFQKITPSLFIKRKTIAFGESAEIEENEGRLIVNPIPDAVYLKEKIYYYSEILPQFQVYLKVSMSCTKKPRKKRLSLF